MVRNLPRSPEDGGPCLGCGLCCDGTLFARVEVNGVEQNRLESMGHELVTVSEKTYLPQPCAFADCGRCAIYETRFAKCRSFRCALLRRYEAGEITSPEARSIVEEALDLLGRVRHDDPHMTSFEERHRTRAELVTQLENEKAGMPRAGAERLLHIIALDTFLERFFRNKKIKPESGVPAPGRTQA